MGANVKFNIILQTDSGIQAFFLLKGWDIYLKLINCLAREFMVAS